MSVEPLPTRLDRRLHGLFWLAVGLVAIAIASASSTVIIVPFPNWRSYLDGLSGDGSADAYTPGIHRQLQWIAGLVLAFLGILISLGTCFRKAVGRASLQIIVRLHAEATESAGWARSHRTTLLAIGIASLAAALMPLPYMDEEIRYDEAHTYVNYSHRPLLMAMTRYDAPNNHVLHSILAHCSLSVFGDSLFGFRFPTYAAGILTVAVLTLWISLLSRSTIGLASGLLLASSPTAVEHLTNARGYTLTALFFVLCLLFVWLIVRRGSTFAWIGWVVSAALSIYAVPTMVYGVWIAMIWLLGLGRSMAENTSDRALSWWLKVALSILAIGLLSLVFYAPILATNDLDQLRQLFRGSRSDWSQLLSIIPERARLSCQWMTWEIPFVWKMTLGVGFLASWFHSETTIRLVTRTLSMAALTVAIPLMVQRMVPPERAWYFLYPIFLGMVALGWSQIESHLLKKRIGLGTLLLSLAFTSSMAFRLHRSQILHHTPRQCTFRELDRIANYLHDSTLPNQPIILVTPASAPVIYAFERKGWPSDHFLVPGRGLTDDRSALLVTSLEFQQKPRDVLEQLGLWDLFSDYHFTKINSFATAEVYRLEKP